METTVVQNPTTENKIVNKTIQLIDGRFTKREAIQILNDVLDVKINFHKLQRLSKTEGYVNGDYEFDSSRILELISDKKDTKDFLKSIISDGYNIKISSTINITVEE